MAKNLPTVQESWAWSLDQEDSLEKGITMHSSILAWRIPGQRSLVGYKSIESQGDGHIILPLIQAQ